MYGVSIRYIFGSPSPVLKWPNISGDLEQARIDCGRILDRIRRF